MTGPFEQTALLPDYRVLLELHVILITLEVINLRSNEYLLQNFTSNHAMLLVAVSIKVILTK